MTWVRRCVRPLSVIWLMCQLTTFALALPECWLGSADSGELACACPHEAGSTCPMHHGSQTDAARCSLHSAGRGALALRSLLGSVGLAFARSSSMQPAPAGYAPPFASASARQLPATPESPPPRA